MKFKSGDRVRILRKARTRERGWQNSWQSDMTKLVGKIGRVTYVRSDCLHDVEVKVPGDATAWGYPDFVLRKVRKATKPRRKT